jgi:hypothetical protein
MVASNTSPFTGQMQLQSWSTGYIEGSVSYQPMDFADAQPWLEFFNALNGMANVFTFPSAVCTAFPLEFTTDGTTARHFRLKSNSSKWSVSRGKIYTFGMDIREAT